ncbi:hypothetical protein FB45DRAFT_1060792 [Roridomyces roridus]|uniref:MYND-type domain-containing protein n=1 Tax=Roridomyces roridus TaxID=1738132 RepID=A0AAD7FJX9_9AGAR|nr:hypothetical protein FB45DRAFT_1060792 [Roridomyces roridus]
MDTVIAQLAQLRQLDSGNPHMARVGRVAQASMQLGAKYRHIQQEWERIKDDPSLRLDLSEPHRCHSLFCQRNLEEPLQVCGGCQGVAYCSPECAKAGWSVHKLVCAGRKRDMENRPRFKAILEQFPWTSRGAFISCILVQFGLLGVDRIQVGYWAYNVKDGTIWADFNNHLAPWEPLILSEQRGWRLPEAQIPSLENLHLANAMCPRFPPAFEESWRSYYEWRGLPITSPAALLLHWPLAVYACLKALGIAPVHNCGFRRSLTVHYIGAEDELTFLRVFGELALLFPNTDLDIIMFGPSVSKAVESGITMDYTESARPLVFEYTSPASCGSGTIRIFLDGHSTIYLPSRGSAEQPDAIVALHAGLGTDSSWYPVIYQAAELSIPFAVTDYDEASIMAIRLDLMEQALTCAQPSKGSTRATEKEKALFDVFKRGLRDITVVDIQGAAARLRKADKRTTLLNDFMCPAVTM